MVSANFSAEYGAPSGGVVNTITRSGANRSTAPAFWFYRNDRWKRMILYANDQSARNCPQQAGGSFGGALIKDKLFYFLSRDYAHRKFRLRGHSNEGRTDRSIAPGLDRIRHAGGGPQRRGRRSAMHRDQFAVAAVLRRSLPRNFKQPRASPALTIIGRTAIPSAPALNFLHDKSPQRPAVGRLAHHRRRPSLATRTTPSACGPGRLAWTAIPTTSMVNEARGSAGITDRAGGRLQQVGAGPSWSGACCSSRWRPGSNLGAGIQLPAARRAQRDAVYGFADNLAWTKGKHTAQVRCGCYASRATTTITSSPTQFGSVHVRQFDIGVRAGLSAATRQALKSWSDLSRRRLEIQSPISSINDYGFYVQDQFRMTRRPDRELRHCATNIASLPQPHQVANPDYPQTAQDSGIVSGISLHALGHRLQLGRSENRSFARVSACSTPVSRARFINNLLEEQCGLYQSSLSLERLPMPAQLGRPARSIRSASRQFLLERRRIEHDSVRRPQHARRRTPSRVDLAIEHQLGCATSSLTTSYIWSRGLQLHST